MNQAQTLIDLEKFMSSVCRRGYLWKDFASDYDQWLDDARAVYDEELEYSPLIQAYFDLMPECITWDDQDIFDCPRAFKNFQYHLSAQHRSFMESLENRSDGYQNNLDGYFEHLVDRYRKLLLVRVDLSYQFEQSVCIRQFVKDIKKLINRIQNKDTIFTDQVGYAYRLEQGGKSKGYHCHLLVIYNGSERCRDGYLAQAIGELWQDKITHGDGLFYNCNQKKHKRYYEDEGVLGLGMIERRNKTAIKNAYNTIHYLTRHKHDQYLRVKLNRRMRVFHTGQVKSKSSID